MELFVVVAAVDDRRAGHAEVGDDLRALARRPAGEAVGAQQFRGQDSGMDADRGQAGTPFSCPVQGNSGAGRSMAVID
jgi:hypothetical protein